MYESKADNGINGVAIWPIAYRVRFDSSRELDVDLGGSRIRVPGNVLLGRNGTLFTDKVELQFTLFDITNPRQRAAASGDFTGQLPDGAMCRLNSYGIFDLDIHDLNGGLLTLQPEAAIELSIALPPLLVKRAPKRVGFFHFNNLTGVWIHAGTFDFVPHTLTYNGTVKKFGVPHNLDDPQDTTCVTVQIVNIYDGSGLPNMLVTVQALQYSSSGTTDANGFVCLLVQRNANFSVTAQGTPYGNGQFWGTPQPVTLMSPNFSSTAADCGNPSTCPFVGTVGADFTVGIGAASST